jgi:hypothetical protein
MGFSARAGWLGGGAGLVIDSVALGCSEGMGLLAQAGLRISAPSKVLFVKGTTKNLSPT